VIESGPALSCAFAGKEGGREGEREGRREGSLGRRRLTYADAVDGVAQVRPPLSFPPSFPLSLPPSLPPSISFLTAGFREEEDLFLVILPGADLSVGQEGEGSRRSRGGLFRSNALPPSLPPSLLLFPSL